MANGSNDPRPAKTERRFFDKDGKPSPRASGDVVRASVTFVESGEVIEMDLTKLSPEMITAAAAFGIMTSVTNAAGGSNPNATPFERALDRWDTIESGEWQGEREGGPQINLIVQAAVALGYDETAVRAKFKSGEITAAQLMKNEAIEVKVLELKEANLAAKRKAAQGKAGAAASDLKSLLG
jgi:hypothetical protein